MIYNKAEFDGRQIPVLFISSGASIGSSLDAERAGRTPKPMPMPPETPTAIAMA